MYPVVLTSLFLWNWSPFHLILNPELEIFRTLFSQETFPRNFSTICWAFENSGLLGRRKVNIYKSLYAQIYWEIINFVCPAYVGKWIIYSHLFLVVVGFWFHFLTQLIPFSLRPVALLAKIIKLTRIITRFSVSKQGNATWSYTNLAIRTK